MKSLILSSALLLVSSYAYVDLGPAYGVVIKGSQDWKLVRTYEKEPLFIEGFELVDDNHYIESVGMYWSSKIQKVEIDHEEQDTEIIKSITIDKSLFGEGCTKFGDKIYQMTYREGKVSIFDAKTFEKIGEKQMPKQMEEGWGLSHDENFIYASDGTYKIFKINPETFEVISFIEVKGLNGKHVRYINELEVVDQFIYANVLPLNIIIRFDKETGQVDKVWDFKKIHDLQMEHVNSQHLSFD